MRWHRLLRALAFVAGGLVFSVLIIFIFSNLAPINVHWRIPATVGYSYDLTLPEVNTWLIALVPLLLGLVAGYLYQTPARMHHVREALRHRHRVHELEHELKEMRTSLDRLLMMPEDGRPAIPAQIMAPVERREAESEDERDPRLPDEPAAVEVLAAKPVKEEVKKAAVRKAPAAVKAARPRRRFFGGLQAEVAEIKLPASIPATIVARPRRNGRAAAEGKAVPAKAEPEATAPARPARKRTSKKSS